MSQVHLPWTQATTPYWWGLLTSSSSGPSRTAYLIIGRAERLWRDECRQAWGIRTFRKSESLILHQVAIDRLTAMSSVKNLGFTLDWGRPPARPRERSEPPALGAQPEVAAGPGP